ncbi:unnamed protein product [Closterium sp. NIES-64]|nr:unnamed protein product [Closterium sp. NIES-64]
MKQCGDAVNGVTEERKMLEGARMKLDEMSRNIIEGVAAANAKASEDAVEKQLKLVEERLVASVAQGIKKAVKEDLLYSAIPPESMKVLKDVVVIAGGLLSKTTADTALQLGVVGHPVEPVGKRAFSSTPPVAPVIAPALGVEEVAKARCRGDRER